jgi:hypothetical protein
MGRYRTLIIVSRESLPFEPKSTKPKSKSDSQPLRREDGTGPTNDSQGQNIPKVVSDRMLRRALIFSGLPMLVSLAILGVSYYIVLNRIFDLSGTVVLFASLAFLGLSVVGLSYGILSASWDEDRVGNWFGYADFQVNFDRMLSAYKASREARRNLPK